MRGGLIGKKFRGEEPSTKKRKKIETKKGHKMVTISNRQRLYGGWGVHGLAPETQQTCLSRYIYVCTYTCISYSLCIYRYIPVPFT